MKLRNYEICGSSGLSVINGELWFTSNYVTHDIITERWKNSWCKFKR